MSISSTGKSIFNLEFTLHSQTPKNMREGKSHRNKQFILTRYEYIHYYYYGL